MSKTKDKPKRTAGVKPPADTGTPEQNGHPVAMGIPITSDLPAGYMSRHVDVRLDSFQSATLSRVRQACDDEHVRLNNGRPVISSADAVRYILETIARSIGGGVC